MDRIERCPELPHGELKGHFCPISACMVADIAGTGTIIVTADISGKMNVYRMGQEEPDFKFQSDYCTNW